MEQSRVQGRTAPKWRKRVFTPASIDALASAATIPPSATPSDKQKRNRKSAGLDDPQQQQSVFELYFRSEHHRRRETVERGMRRLRRQEFRQALRTVHLRGVQEFLQTVRSPELDLYVSRKPELSGRSTSPEPVSILSLQKMHQNRNAKRR